MNIEETIGYKLAITFKPFIDPKCTEHLEIVKDMAKAINNTFHIQIEEYTNRIVENAKIEWSGSMVTGNIDKESITSQLPKFLKELE